MRQPRPAVWTAVFTGAWMFRPGTEEISTRNGTVNAFTVAASKEEAILTMHNGLGWFDDIEDPGKATHIRRLTVAHHLAPETMAAMLEDGARFIVPLDRLTRTDKILIAWVLLSAS